MSVSIYASVWYGIFMDEDELYKQVEKEKITCSCGVDSEKIPKTASFCPFCGNVIYTQDKVSRIPGADDFNYLDLPNGIKSKHVYSDGVIIGFELTATNDLYYGSQCEEVVWDLPVEAMKKLLKELLEPCGLWDESRVKHLLVGNLS